MRGKKKKIDTAGGASLSVDNPFAGVSSAGFKEAPAPISGPSKGVEKKKKKGQTLILRRLKAGKGGKVVTEVSGFDMNPDQIDQLLKRLQARLGTGGTRKGKVIELQGEKRQAVAAILEADGFRVKGV